MYTLILKPRAIGMTKDAYDWYELQKTGLGEELLDELDGVYHKFETHPEYFGKVKKNFRQAALIRFPFVIVYEIIKTEVVVFAVFHTRRNPRYKFKDGKIIATSLNATIVIGAGAAPFNRTWYYGSAGIGGASGDAYLVTANKLGDYRLEVTDVKGCRGVSNTITIKDSVSQKFFILPNPNAGQFMISYHQDIGLSTKKRILIYSSVGQKIKDEPVTVSLPYQLIPINISGRANGIYSIELVNDQGVVEVRGRVLISR